MSQENVTVVRETIEAFDRKDFGGDSVTPFATTSSSSRVFREVDRDRRHRTGA